MITYDTVKLSILTLIAVVFAVMATPLEEVSQQIEKRESHVCLLQSDAVREYLLIKFADVIELELESKLFL